MCNFKARRSWAGLFVAPILSARCWLKRASWARVLGPAGAAMNNRYSVIVVVAASVLLAGCAAHWVRTDGGPVDNAQGQSTLAQCRGEGATAGAGIGEWGQRTNVEMKVTEACMARNGYIR